MPPERVSDGTGLTEAHVVINGVTLTFGQSMALRVAASDFHMQMSDHETAEAIGWQLADGYKARLSEVLKLMIGNAVK